MLAPKDFIGTIYLHHIPIPWYTPTQVPTRYILTKSTNTRAAITILDSKRTYVYPLQKFFCICSFLDLWKRRLPFSNQRSSISIYPYAVISSHLLFAILSKFLRLPNWYLQQDWGYNLREKTNTCRQTKTFIRCTANYTAAKFECLSSNFYKKNWIYAVIINFSCCITVNICLQRFSNKHLNIWTKKEGWENWGICPVFILRVLS